MKTAILILLAAINIYQKKEYNWSGSLLKMPEEWYSTTDAINIANSVIQYQSPQGGWPKSTNLAKSPISPEDIPKAGDGRANSLDNDATTVPMEYLALVIDATGEEKYKISFFRGLDYLFKAQYSNGGWPQFWPLRGDRYYSRITYNDGAMIRVMNLLQNVAKGKAQYSFIDKEHRLKADKAVEKGIECILKTQIKKNGNLTVWCAQHDENTLEPAWARAYEPPSLSGSESVGIVRFLMSLENPSTEIIAAINGAVKWFKEVQINGYKCVRGINSDGQKDSWLEPDESAKALWARFYELETNNPLFLGRDSRFRYSLKEIEVERRGGYRYYGNWANELIYIEYPEWLKKHEKLRVIMTSDFPPIGVVKSGDNVPNSMKSDPDDMQSMVRFLLYANEFDIEGLVASAGTFAFEAHKKNILDVINEYEKVYNNLKTHDADFPTADYLRSVTFEGKGKNHGLNLIWGCGKQSYTDIIGEGLDSEASNAIIAAADKPDPRPVWIGVWGGPREVAQAIRDVKNTRSEEELKAFIGKLRIFLIGCQDATHEWLMNEFPDLFIIESKKTYQGMFGGHDPVSDLEWVNKNIRFNHGPLCAMYPHEGMGCTGVCEGDSPAFLYLVSANRGINDPEDPTQASWGGQYVRRENTNHYVDGPGKKTISKWRDDYQKEFMERADWCVSPKKK